MKKDAEDLKMYLKMSGCKYDIEKDAKMDLQMKPVDVLIIKGTKQRIKHNLESPLILDLQKKGVKLMKLFLREEKEILLKLFLQGDKEKMIRY